MNKNEESAAVFGIFFFMILGFFGTLVFWTLVFFFSGKLSTKQMTDCESSL